MSEDITGLGLFEGFGVEMEYMIVDSESLAVRPIADELLRDLSGEHVSDVELGPIALSNELVLHVVELKTNGPVGSLADLASPFNAAVRTVNETLAPHHARLMPSAMHPTMDPHKEMRIWPHDSGPIYACFDRIFDCHGHGWANLQSTHLNLPFSGDDQFGRLHAAIRVLLPLLPALAASSPLCDSRLTGLADTRLAVYRSNAANVPSVSGLVIPERVFTRADYEQHLLGRIYRDLSPLDPEGILQHEWVNARGAIARFDRDTIEIRVLDIQECPAADVAILEAVVSVLRALVEGRMGDLQLLRGWDERALLPILEQTIQLGEGAQIHQQDYLRDLGLSPPIDPTAGKVWELLLSRASHRPGSEQTGHALQNILRHGTLATRIRRAVGPDPTPSRILGVYRTLADCLRTGTAFTIEG